MKVLARRSTGSCAFRHLWAMLNIFSVRYGKRPAGRLELDTKTDLSTSCARE
jgi:hypothetical protein